MIDTFSIYLHIFSLSLIILLLTFVLTNWDKTSYRESNFYLSLALTVYLFAHINSVLVLNSQNHVFFYTRIIHNLLTVSVGPLIYLATTKRYTFESHSAKDFFHFIPLFLFTALYSVYLFDLNISNYPERYSMDSVMKSFFLIQFPTYIILTWITIGRLKFKVPKAFHFLLFGLLMIGILQIIMSIALYFNPEFNYIRAPFQLNIFSFFLVFFLWECLRDSDLLFLKKKYFKSNVSIEKLHMVLKKVQSAMDSNKLYLQKGVRIKEVGEMISEPSEYISQAISSILNSNFNDFINDYRIEYFKDLIKSGDYDNYTLLGLAEMSGFRSSSAFNTAFKKKMNMLPSDFRKKYPHNSSTNQTT